MYQGIFTFATASRCTSYFYHSKIFHIFLLRTNVAYTQKYIEKVICKLFFQLFHFIYYWLIYILWLSPRFISIGQLNTLLYLHLQPIYHVVYMESYYLIGMRYLILRWASHLDAFSVYPIHT